MHQSHLSHICYDAHIIALTVSIACSDPVLTSLQ